MSKISLSLRPIIARIGRTEFALTPAEASRVGVAQPEPERKDRSPTFLLPRLLFSLLLGWYGGGCASAPKESAAPKPGNGIAEYREVTREAHGAVAATVTALESLGLADPQPLLQHPALPGFDRTFRQLELTSIKARARAATIIARGQAYFEEWQENLSAVTNRADARMDTERYDRLLGHFERVRQRSEVVRGDFRPFMAKLREFRARLDQPVTAASGAAAQQEIKGLITDGKRVLQTLESVSMSLNEAETELRTTLAGQTIKGQRP